MDSGLAIDVVRCRGCSYSSSHLRVGVGARRTTREVTVRSRSPVHPALTQVADGLLPHDPQFNAKSRFAGARHLLRAISGSACWACRVDPDPPLESDPERGGHLVTSRICPRARNYRVPSHVGRVRVADSVNSADHSARRTLDRLAREVSTRARARSRRGATHQSEYRRRRPHGRRNRG